MTDSTTDLATPPPDGGDAVQGAGVHAGPACARRVIAVGKLTAHPGNVRADLDLTPEFCASVAANGVRVPLLITTTSDGGYRVIEGHRRLAAAVKAGLAEVPYHLDGERAADEEVGGSGHPGEAPAATEFDPHMRASLNVADVSRERTFGNQVGDRADLP